MSYYYEWISEKTGNRHKVAAVPYLPKTIKDRFKVDFDEYHRDDHDYNGEPVYLMRGETFVEQVA